MTCNSSISIYKGSSKTLRITVDRESDDERQDLTGSTIEFQVKAADGDPDPALISKSIGSGITLLAQSGDTLGQAEIELSPSDTSSLAAGIYRFDVVVVLASGKRYYVIPPSDFVVKAVVNGV